MDKPIAPNFDNCLDEMLLQYYVIALVEAPETSLPIEQELIKRGMAKEAAKEKWFRKDISWK